MATCQCWSFFHYDIIHPSHVYHLFAPKTDPNVSEIHQSNSQMDCLSAMMGLRCILFWSQLMYNSAVLFPTVPNSWGRWILRCVVQVSLCWYTWRGTNRRCEMQMMLDFMHASFLFLAVVHHQFVKYSNNLFHFVSTPCLADAMKLNLW